MTIWHGSYRFAEHSAAVLQLREVWNTGYVVAVDHTGSPFKIPASTWKGLQLATEDDFCAAAKMAEIAAGTMVNESFGDPNTTLDRDPMDPDKLRYILAAHEQLLRGEPGGVRAILLGANLCNLNLRNVNLRGAILRGAILHNTDLSGADLCNADLHNANLSCAILRHADIQNASLHCAIFHSANLHDAKFCRANLRGADFYGANLRGADFRDANLTNARGLSIADDAPQRLQAVARAALASDHALEMDEWHTCDTTHCIAGWAIRQAGALGRLLEQMHGAEIAGLMLLGTEAHRHFYTGNDQAREFLRSVLND